MKKQKTSDGQLSLFSDVDFNVPVSTEGKDKASIANITNEIKEINVSATQTQTQQKRKVQNQEQERTVTRPKRTTQILELENVSDQGHAIGLNQAQPHYDLTNLFTRLAQSNFRSSFHLKPKDREYIDKKGLETIRQHATDFISKRLAPAFIPNDGQQTPMRGHPVFLAQHATGCCCRGCFYKWHHIPKGRALTSVEQAYAVEVLMAWITKEYKKFHRY